MLFKDDDDDDDVDDDDDEDGDGDVNTPKDLRCFSHQDPNI